MIDDNGQAADDLKRIIDLNHKIDLAKIDHITKAEVAKDAKKEVESLQDQLNGLISEIANPRPLFDGPPSELELDAFVVSRNRGADVYLRAANLDDAAKYAGDHFKQVTSVDPVYGDIPDGARIETVPLGYADEDARQEVEAAEPDEVTA